MEYNADQQERTLEFLQNQLTPESPWTPVFILLVPGLLGLGIYWGLKIKRRHRPLIGSPETALGAGLGRNGFYPRFLDVVHRFLDLKPQPGQTPLEFGLLTKSCLENVENVENVGCVQRTLADAPALRGVGCVCASTLDAPYGITGWITGSRRHSLKVGGFALSNPLWRPILDGYGRA